MLQQFLRIVCACAVVGGVFTSFAAVTHGGDWPQVLGPARNGVAKDERILDSFDADGPTELWTRDAGQGVGGVAVQGDRVVLFHRTAQGDRAECFRKLNGEVLWQSAHFTTRYQSTILDDSGPRCVPVIADGRVFLYASNGDLHCVKLDDGSTLWSRSLFADYATGAESGYFGAGSTPIVSEGKLWINVGGSRAEAGIVALDPETGKTLWKGTAEGGSYSSPVEVTIAGESRLIFLTRMNLLSLNPATQQVDWRVPFGQRGPTVNGASPLVFDGNILVTAAYGIGCKCVALKLTQPDVIWESQDAMASQYTTPIVVNGTAYGVDGRHDLGVARLRAFDPLTGDVLWTKKGFGKATLILADGKLLALTTAGKLVLIAPDKTAYKELASAQISDERCLALPALSDGLLFVKDQSSLKCLDLRRAD